MDIQLAVITRGFRRALQVARVRLHEIEPAHLAYPSDGAVVGHDQHHPGPVGPVCWLPDKICPSVERAIARHRAAGD